MNKIFWVRHGENQANLTKEFSYKYIDYPLTDKGILQAQQTARYFREKQIEFIYSSPLKRARETAELISHELHLPVLVLEEFRELNVGALELQPVSKVQWDIYQSVINDWRGGKLDSRFPEGEDYHQLLERTQQGLRKVLYGKQDTRIIIVGHGGMLALTICDICPNADPKIIFQAPPHNCSISQLEFLDNSAPAILRTWSDFSHLEGEAARVVSGVPTPEEKIGK